MLALGAVLLALPYYSYKELRYSHWEGTLLLVLGAVLLVMSGAVLLVLGMLLLVPGAVLLVQGARTR